MKPDEMKIKMSFFVGRLQYERGIVCLVINPPGGYVATGV